MKMISAFKNLHLYILLILVSSNAFSIPTGLDSWIKSNMKKYNIVGLSIAIINDGKISETKTYGYADKENKIKVNKKTLFQAASISKPITATATMITFQNNLKLSLDPPINN